MHLYIFVHTLASSCQREVSLPAQNVQKKQNTSTWSKREKLFAAFALLLVLTSVGLGVTIIIMVNLKYKYALLLVQTWKFISKACSLLLFTLTLATFKISTNQCYPSNIALKSKDPC